MSFKMKVSDTTTPTSLGGGMILGAIVGAIVGAFFAPQILFSADYRGVLPMVVCACLGIIVGAFGGGLVDLWLAPQVEKAIQNVADEATKRHRNGGKW